MFGRSLEDRKAAILFHALKGHTAAKKKDWGVVKENVEQVRLNARRLGPRLDELGRKKVGSVEAAAEDILSIVDQKRVSKRFFGKILSQFKLIESIALRWRLEHVGTSSSTRRELKELKAA
jgi:hypothetical protein